MAASKLKTTYICSECGYESLKWLGHCPSCGEWNTFVEEVVNTSKEKGRSVVSNLRSKPVLIKDIVLNDKEIRIKTGDAEFDRVMGGGIVSGSIVLVGGEPGIGKSTLMLQVAVKLSGLKILYVSGEESQQQIKMRYDRIGNSDMNNIYILNETDVDVIMEQTKEIQPDMVIVDSIQTMFCGSLDSSAGSISQIKECTALFQQYAKSSHVPVFLIGHITKDGSIAGPKILEHIVDVVVMFEGERNYGYRILRAIKNRFGSSSELGIYLMQQNGLTEVSNPSEVLISKNTENLSGVCLAATLEGMRPIIIEIQALVSTAAYGVPQRTTTGFDYRRLNMLLAVLEKRCNFKLASKDVFLNITGGIKVDDPAIDLAVVCAILSSTVDMPLDHDCCFAGEIGLSGEIRPVTHIEKRLSEAEKIGFKRMLVSGYGIEKLNRHNSSIEIIPVNRVDEAFRHLFG